MEAGVARGCALRDHWGVIMAITVQLLTEDDCLQPEDWVRPLKTTPNDMGGDARINSFSTYGGRPLNHLKWVRAGDVFSERWMGLTLKELGQEYKRFGGFTYEVVRGDLPATHCWDWQSDKQRAEGADA